MSNLIERLTQTDYEALLDERLARLDAEVTELRQMLQQMQAKLFDVKAMLERFQKGSSHETV